MNSARRSAIGVEIVALWVLLALSATGLVSGVVVVVRLLTATDLLNHPVVTYGWWSWVLIAAWVLAIVLTARLGRMGWLVACAVTVVAIPVFAVVMLLETRATAAQRRQQTSFRQAVARESAMHKADQQGGDA